MLQLVRFDAFLKLFVVIVVLILIAIYYILRKFLFPEIEVYKLFFFSSSVTAIFVALVLSPFCYRWLWQKGRTISSTLYPDLNGTWSGNIETETGAIIEVRAVIRQSILNTEIDMHGKTMKSVTLAATPSIEAGQHKLYYTYRAEPENPRWSPYHGTTTLTVRFARSGEGQRIGAVWPILHRSKDNRHYSIAAN